MRVAIRRIEAAAGAFRDSLPRGPRRELLATLRKWRRRLGRVRDREVLAAALAEPELAAAGGTALAALRERVLVSRDRERRRAVRWIRPQRVRRLARLLRRLQVSIEHMELAPALAQAERRCARREAIAAAALARARDTDEDEVLHSARIALKRWRYAGEALNGYGRGPAEAERKSLRRLQRDLGTVHDRAALHALLSAQAARAAARERPRRAEAFSVSAALALLQREQALRDFRSRPEVAAPPDAPPRARRAPRA